METGSNVKKKNQKTRTKPQNQVHPPRPKKLHKDELGNDRNRLWFKCGNSTMLFADNLTKNEIVVLTNSLFKLLHQFNSKLEGQWIITK